MCQSFHFSHSNRYRSWDVLYEFSSIGHKTEEIVQNRQKEVEKRKTYIPLKNLPSTWCTRCTRTIYHKINFFADSESKFIFKKSQRTPNSSNNCCILGAQEYSGGGEFHTHPSARDRVKLYQRVYRKSWLNRLNLGCKYILNTYTLGNT